MNPEPVLTSGSICCGGPPGYGTARRLGCLSSRNTNERAEGIDCFRSTRKRSQVPVCFFAIGLFVSTIASRAAEPSTNPVGNQPIWADFVETNFPFFSSVLDGRKFGRELPADNLTPRGIILNLGSECWAC